MACHRRKGDTPYAEQLCVFLQCFCWRTRAARRRHLHGGELLAHCFELPDLQGHTGKGQARTGRLPGPQGWPIQGPLLVAGESCSSMRGAPLRTARGLAQLCARVAWEKKAEDILVLQIAILDNAPAEYFVLATCQTDTHLRAVAEAIEEATRQRGIPAPRREGWEALQWVLLDYIDVVVHLFRPETRTYYRLERLWGDTPMLRLSEQSRRLYTVSPAASEHPIDAPGRLP